MNNKVLVIDDEQGIRDMMQYVLSEEGFDVATAPDGIAGYEAYNKEKFDVVFLDVHMPAQKGTETLARIREKNPEQAVIVCSSSHDPDYNFKEHAAELGVYHCFYKPVDIDDVLTMMREATKIKTQYP